MAAATAANRRRPRGARLLEERRTVLVGVAELVLQALAARNLVGRRTDAVSSVTLVPYSFGGALRSSPLPRAAHAPIDPPTTRQRELHPRRRGQGAPLRARRAHAADRGGGRRAPAGVGPELSARAHGRSGRHRLGRTVPRVGPVELRQRSHARCRRRRLPEVPVSARRHGVGARGAVQCPQDSERA